MQVWDQYELKWLCLISHVTNAHSFVINATELVRYHTKLMSTSTNYREEVVTVPSTSNDQEGWKVQRISVNGELPQSSNRRRGYSRSQLQPVVSGGKRNRPAPSPPTQPISYRINAKEQLDKYFDWRNKENTPGNAVNRREDDQRQANPVQETEESTMGSNLSRHNGKGLTGRRTQSSGNLCEPKGKLNSMGKILVPCSSAQRERYKFCGSLPNHLDDKDVLDDDQRDNNNIMSDTIGGNFGGTLPHKKRSLGVHFSDSGPTGTLDLVKHRSQDSFDENDPWRYQQSDLDLVRCRHGNFDSVKRNRSVDTVLVESGRKYGRGVALEDRCHRNNSDLDLVGTLPKRKQDVRNSSGRSLESNSSSSQPCIVNATDDDLLMKIVHKPDCELLKHRQQLGKCVDLKLSKLTSGEPQDQGYASERSPEDEHPPSLPGQPFPSVTPESTFRVTLQKSSRGLGLSVSGGGTAGPVRVKRLFPQQPAALSNKLQIGDILLAANGIPLTGLTNYEALEVLRTTPSTVELVVCRLPGDSNVTPPGAPPPPPARREPSSLRILNPLPPLQIEPCGEFDIEMTKVGGSLGFTLRKADSSALGHYVRALVREPALSDGRIRPGDKIVAVDNAPLSPMSHEEAVQLLRQCGPTVKLRLYRDLAQTPVSALSPTEPDHPLRPPRTSLRQEAVDMLCDLAVRKLSPGTSSGSSSCKQQSPGASCNSPRRLRRLATRTSTAETNQETPEGKLHDVQTTSSTASQAETASDSDQCSVKTQITNSQANTPATDIIDPPPLYDIYDDDDNESSKPTPNNAAARPSFLDLSAPQGKPHFQFCSVDSDGEYPGDGDVILAEAERGRLAEPNYDNDRSVTVMSSDEHDNDLPSEPASMPPMLSSTSSTSTAAFSYKNPAYQSANPACGSAVSDPAGSKNKTTHSSDQDIPGKILGTDDPGGSKGLLKWKGVMFAPNDEVDTEHDPEETGKDTTDSAALAEDLEQGSEVFMVELTRGWNSRLGFSLQPEGNCTVISVVHPDSVAAKDGRLKQGDVLLMVNEESVEHMSTADIIDLLRKIRGSIGITVMRKSKRDNIT
ncbi:PTN13 phosphatase [Camponotus japonicus]